MAGTVGGRGELATGDAVVVEEVDGLQLVVRRADGMPETT